MFGIVSVGNLNEINNRPLTSYMSYCLLSQYISFF